MLLKSSDFVLHDISKETVFEGCLPDDAASSPNYELELVLRKWYLVDPSREFRCFVRGGKLLGEHLGVLRSCNAIRLKVTLLHNSYFSTRYKLLRLLKQRCYEEQAGRDHRNVLE